MEKLFVLQSEFETWKQPSAAAAGFERIKGNLGCSSSTESCFTEKYEWFMSSLVSLRLVLLLWLCERLFAITYGELHIDAKCA